MNKKVDQERRSAENELRAELERLLANDEREIQSLAKEAMNVLPAKSAHFMDYNTVKVESDASSKDIVDAISNFYLDAKIIDEVPYVKQKATVDKITVSSLLFQMKTAEHAIIRLLEEIEGGNFQARTFEVLASLQRSKMEIVKHLAQFMIIMENNYKNLKEDYRIIKAETQLTDTVAIDDGNNGNGNKFRGTKGLIEALREAVPEKRHEKKDIKMTDAFEQGMDDQEG